MRAEEAVAALRAQVDALQKAQAFSGGGNGDGGASAFMESEVEARVARRAAERVAGGRKERERIRAELSNQIDVRVKLRIEKMKDFFSMNVPTKL